MKCFERMAMAHIKARNTLKARHTIQFANLSNSSSQYAISIAIHTAIPPLNKRSTYVRMLFIDYSSALNNYCSSKLFTKLRAQGLDTTVCNWILDFLTGRPQALRIGNNTSSTLS